MDIDNDGIVNGGCDNCTGGTNLQWGNPWQEDYDGDGIGNSCDPCPLSTQSPCPASPEPPVPQPSIVDVWSSTIPAVTLAELHIYGSDRLGMYLPNEPRDTAQLVNVVSFVRTLRKREYELKDHLGNVRVTISDLKLGNGTPIYSADIRSYTNHYAFGMVQPDRSWVAGGGYRYGYNGKESDNEIKGTGNSLDYGARIYDPRLGRWGSTDVVLSPDQSLYHYVSNNPIIFVDPNGKHEFYYNEKGELSGFKFTSTTKHEVFVENTLGKVNFNDVRFVSIGQLSKPLPVMIKNTPSVMEKIIFGERVISLPDGTQNIFGADNVQNYYVNNDGFIVSPAITGGSPGELPIPYDHYAEDILPPEQNAENALYQLEKDNQAAGTNAHFYSRHGAQTSMAQQAQRAMNGLTPDLIWGPIVNSARFMTHVGQLNAVADVTAQFSLNKKAQQKGFSLKSPGIGFLKNTHNDPSKRMKIVGTATYLGIFDKNTEQLKTLYPLLEP